jgi:nucleoside-triphosphatase THEP1
MLHIYVFLLKIVHIDPLLPMMHGMRVVVTGALGVGKSTVCHAVLKQAHPVDLCGFCTTRREDENGAGQFMLTSWTGESAPFARPAVDSSAPCRINQKVFDTLGCAALNPPSHTAWCVIDELGIVEQQAQRFIMAVQQAWRRSAPSLFVIQQRALSFWQAVLEQEPMPYRIVPVTVENRTEMPATVLSMLRKI